MPTAMLCPKSKSSQAVNEVCIKILHLDGALYKRQSTVEKQQCG